jgi:hypothetical protein
MGGIGLFMSALTLSTFYTRTSLEGGRLRISVGILFFPIIVLRVSVSEIESAEVVSYSTFADWRRKYVWAIRNRVMGIGMGTQGVCLLLRSGRRLSIGSATPRRLLDEIQKQMR